jgi:preprotein translocase subunit SecA
MKLHASAGKRAASTRNGRAALQKWPTDGFAFVLVVYAWLQWHCAQDRKRVLAGGSLYLQAREAGLDVPRRAAGGLVVLQWGAAPSVRVEKQLRGRAGRQGDAGTSYAIVHLADESLWRHFPDVVVSMAGFQKLDGVAAGAVDALSAKLLGRRGGYGGVCTPEVFASQLRSAKLHARTHELEAIRGNVRRDNDVDAWRRLVSGARDSVMFANRQEVLQVWLAAQRCAHGS